MEGKIETWNTGNGYSAHGQVIAAVCIGRKIYFVDHTRMLNGEFTCCNNDNRTNHMRAMVTLAYDNGLYDHISERSTRTTLEAAAKELVDSYEQT